jgi:serine/threonine protein kinase
MQALEAMGVIHRDLAARNVMLDKWGQVCFICRFLSHELLRIIRNLDICFFRAR